MASRQRRLKQGLHASLTRRHFDSITNPALKGRAKLIRRYAAKKQFTARTFKPRDFCGNPRRGLARLTTSNDRLKQSSLEINLRLTAA